ncbi:sensor histidine kinase [Salirhabdus sp. Marseille-P4669]|uniref:sensor histidine kinase n=1 Tax=Salirhabdus sp. Marseille-P4669 TaxID=2042310 RepID=UPI000C7AAB61|nr:HAMP domain-containing sensor histidine kinase [Salirhabdus sp. Marseille-P4669]
MFRNKEIRQFLFFSSLFSIFAIGIGFLSSTTTGIFLLVTCAVLTTIFTAYTLYRYQQLEKLSEYLRSITAGNYSLDIRDNSEGELSILKNDIYKVTLMLSESSDSLKEDKQSLTDAISDISHQLKTPLTSMMVMADLLRDKSLSAEKRNEFTHNIQVQLERMEWLVSSLLKLSKIDAGTVQFKKEKVNVQKLINQTIQPLIIPMELKEQTLEVIGEVDVAFIGDENWTAEAILNILKNCVEHTDKHGKLTISFSENTLFTEIIIQDNGKGIRKEDLPYIFKRFFKGTNASEGSVGIGLAMAQRIITSQNGDIEVKSEPSIGTTFSIKFYKQVI